MSQLRGEIAVATGASKGIGTSIAEQPMNEQLLTVNASPKQVLLNFYEAEANYMKAFEENGSASFDEMQKTMDSEVVLHQSPDLPFGGEYVGYKGYEDWAKAMASIFDKLEVREREFFEHGDKVIVVCRFMTRSRVNGSVQDFPMAQIVTVRKGKIVDFRPFYWNVPAYVAAARSAEN